ncbi:hypothetical protein SADUNF_Sadunf04G0150000 [Salix dunnii]|uniref:ARID domain-containing protein n=1 Tax=Salix dunnii TaxID=1413687 RepID=A0A835MZN0_9ROSI|nr:hypothetical protein SADUNF_Sadunf04G0150000 [Salix dunnii]
MYGLRGEERRLAELSRSGPTQPMNYNKLKSAHACRYMIVNSIHHCISALPCLVDEDLKGNDVDATAAPILTSPSIALNDSALEEKDDTRSSVDLTGTNPATPRPHDHDISNAAAADFIKSEGKGDETVDNNDPHVEPNADGAATATNVDGAKQLSSPPPKNDDEGTHSPPPPPSSHSGPKAEDEEDDDEKSVVVPTEINKKEAPKPPKLDVSALNTPPPLTKSFLLDSSADGYESGTEEEQAAFMRDVESFHKQNHLEFKPPKFYKEELNLLKLWRLVIKLGGYEQALLEYEKNKLKNGELPFSDGPLTESMRTENQADSTIWRCKNENVALELGAHTIHWFADNGVENCDSYIFFFENKYNQRFDSGEKTAMHSNEGYSAFRCCFKSDLDVISMGAMFLSGKAGGSQALASGRARRDAAARAMQGWHSQRLLGNGEVCHPIIKDKNLSSTPKGDKQLKTNGLLKRKRLSPVESAVHFGHKKTIKPQGDAMVIDVGPPADWVKINVQKTVHVQSDPAGRLIISGQPEHLDNPWGVTPFKKVVSLPTRIDPHQTSAVVTLHGQLFVRVPFEMSDL